MSIFISSNQDRDPRPRTTLRLSTSGALLSTSFHILSFRPSLSIARSTLPDTSCTGALILGSASTTPFRIGERNGGVLAGVLSSAVAMRWNAGKRVLSSCGEHFPYCIRESPRARSGRPRRSWRRTDSRGDCVSRISSTASVRAVRALTLWPC